MSRFIKNINENIRVAHGMDHALGSFMQVFDKRININDELVYDYDELFGQSVNKIKLDNPNIDKNDIINKCDIYFKTQKDV